MNTDRRDSLIIEKTQLIGYNYYMPTVAQENGFSLIIRTRDHEPPHVHVWKNKKEMLFYLGSENERPSLRENKGMTQKEALDAFKLVCKYQEELLSKWKEIYG